MNLARYSLIVGLWAQTTGTFGAGASPAEPDPPHGGAVEALAVIGDQPENIRRLLGAVSDDPALSVAGTPTLIRATPASAPIPGPSERAEALSKVTSPAAPDTRANVRLATPTAGHGLPAADHSSQVLPGPSGLGFASDWSGQRLATLLAWSSWVELVSPRFDSGSAGFLSKTSPRAHLWVLSSPAPFIAIWVATAVALPPGIFAQVSVIQAKVDETLKLIQLLLLPVIVALVLYGGFCIHEGKVGPGFMAIAGALILALAVPIARALFNV